MALQKDGNGLSDREKIQSCQPFIYTYIQVVFNYSLIIDLMLYMTMILQLSMKFSGNYNWKIPASDDHREDLLLAQ